MNNPLRDPEQLELRPRRLDPEFDDMPEDEPVFKFTLDYGPTYVVMGEAARDEEIDRLTGDEIAFTLETIDA